MKYSSLGLAVLLLPAVGSAQFLDSRNRAMGGAGVASSHYVSAGFKNPALLTVFDSGDSFAFILPSAGFGVADEDGLIKAIEDFQDEVDRLQANPLAADPQTVGALADRLLALDGKRATVGAGGALALAFPSKTFAWGLVAHSWAEGRVGVAIDPNDEAAIRAANPLTIVSVLDNLGSEGRILGTGTTEVGVAMATELTVGGMGVLSVGATPKLQRIDTYNYSINVNTFDDNDFDDSRYRNHTTRFNVDVGAALRPIPTVTLGLAARNLIEHEVRTVVVAGQQFTHVVEPEVTIGAAWALAGTTLTADVDVVDIERYKNIADESRFVRVGAEFDTLGWLQLRAGVQHDLEDTVDNLYTAGLGFSPLGTVHIDVSGTWDGEKGYGAMAQFWFTF